MRTLTNLVQVDLGFDRASVLTLRLEPRGSNQKQQNEARLRRIYGLLLHGVESLPGVRAATLAGATPLSDENAVMPRIVIADQAPGAEAQPIRMMQVYPNYLRAAGVPLLAGRDLTASDDAPGAAPVAVINEVLAARFGGRARAVGRTFSLGAGRDTFEIVGVAGDVRDRSLREPPTPLAYATFAKAPTGRGQMTLIGVYGGRTKAARRGCSAACRDRRPDDAARPAADHRGLGRRRQSRGAPAGDACRRFRRRGPGTGHDWRLRRPGVFGVAPPRRVRHSTGAWPHPESAAPQHRPRELCGRARRSADRDGRCRGAGACPLRAAVRRGAARSDHPRHRVRRPHDRGLVLAAWVPARWAARVDPALTLRG